MDTFVNRARCPHCGRALIRPAGRPTSKVLLVGDYPGKDEIIQGVSFIDKSSDILKSELLKVGLIWQELRIMNLWQHAESPVKVKDNPKAKPKEGECDFDWHVERVAQEFTGKSHVLLMGSQITQALIGKNAADYAGLQVKVPGFKDIRFWVAPNPALAFKFPIGDLRLAITRFAEDVKKTKK